MTTARMATWAGVAATMMAAIASAAKPLPSPGETYRRGNFQKTIELLKPQADAGVIDAQLMLGQMYLKGEGVQADQGKGLFWIRKAAEQGSAIAAYDLGLLGLNGTSGDQDPRVASRWFRKAAHQHYPDAAFNLAVLYHTGVGVQKDDVLALAWIDAAIRYLPPATGAELRPRFEAQRMKILTDMPPEQVKAADQLISASGPLAWIRVRNGEALEKLGSKSYPLNLRHLARGGTTVVLVFVHADGAVGDTVIENSSGYPEIDAVTVKLLQSADIEPQVVEGRAVESWQVMKWSWHVNQSPWYSYGNLNKLAMPR